MNNSSTTTPDLPTLTSTSISTFVLKTFTILSNPENASAIRWHPSGLSFCIPSIEEFTNSILPVHFRHQKYESFIRQLNMYNFGKVKDAPFASFSNPYFRRDREDLLKFIKRKPEKKKRKDAHLMEMENMGQMEEIISKSIRRQPSIYEQVEENDRLDQGDKQVEGKRVTFDLPQGEDYCALIEASNKWINPREEKCWSDINSFKSFKISLKVLDRPEEEQVVLSEPKSSEPASYGFLRPNSAETTPEEKVVRGKPIANYVNEIFPVQDFDDKYKVKKIIGKGSYGYVAKATRKSDGAYVAIKKIINLFQSLPETRRILREIVLLKNCHHPNIVRMLEVVLPRGQTIDQFDHLYLITEFCDSDLQKVFKSDNIFFEVDDVRFILYQILCGLKYLHSANVVHRDLKPANVLINGQGLVIKICDFGLARIIEEMAHEEEKEKEDSEEEEHVEYTKHNPNANLEKAEKEKIPEEGKAKKKGLARSNTKKMQVVKEEGISSASKIKRVQSLHNPLAKLTLRVTTRWYRAPQIILLEKGYSKPIDVWSVGCIFGELIKMQKAVCSDSLHRFPLFPGKYCYPVSPNTLQVIYKNGYPQGRNDQLAMILSTLGKPTPAQMQFLSDENAKQYLRSVECRQKKGFQEMFPQMPPQIVDILNRTMTFDPRTRATVDQILEHEFFTDCRRKELEYTRPPIDMEFEMSEESLTLEALRDSFKKELKEYYPHK